MLSPYRDEFEEEKEDDRKDGILDDEDDDIDSDEDEVEEIVMHDQLPSADEVKVTVLRQRNQGRLPSWCPDCTTGSLLCILVLLLATFFISFYAFPQLWEAEQQAAASSKATSGGDHMEQPTSAPTKPLAPIEAMLRSDIALRGGVEFQDPDSYQSKALQFLLDRGNVFGELSVLKLQQIYAMLCFYYATDGEGSWNDNYPWLNGHDECLWGGVTCDAQYNVEKLDLTEGGLSGEIAEELQLIESLKELILEDNAGLTGEIPPFLGEMDLKTVKLTDCGFSGDLPFSICKYMNENSEFNLDLDCSKVMCQPSCCDFCY
ncbi:hypothetical protein ACA910_010496 [Epithemia clementina (nom. ined.)]